MDNLTENVKMPAWMKFFILVGLVCIGQFFICALIGIFRGYSIQSLVPVYIMLGGVFVLLKPISKYWWMSYLVFFSIIFFSITSILQGRYKEQGDALFKQGKFSESIVIYQKEISTWYLRGCYNHREPASLFRIAESYSQLGEFDKARQRYLQLVQRYKGYYKERSATEVDELDMELKSIADLKEKLANKVDDYEKAKILFDIAIAYRRIECDYKAWEQYELIQTLDAPQPFKDQAKEFAEAI